MSFFAVGYHDKGSAIIEQQSYHFDSWGKDIRSCRGPFETREEVVVYLNGEHPCKECGFLIDPNYGDGGKLIENKVCWTCNFWLERAAEIDTVANRVTAALTGRKKALKPVVIVDGFTYSIGKEPAKGSRPEPGETRGFGGREFHIQFLSDNRVVVSHNLWAGGQVPDRFFYLFPDNARFLDGNHWVEMPDGTRAMA